MKERASIETETIWAYLHGELRDEKRSAFEQELQADSELRRRFEETARMDRLLRATLPELDKEELSVDAVSDKALRCWEREYDESVRLHSRWQKIFFHPAVGLVGLAAAAVILLVSPVLRSPDGLVWDDPVFSPLALRGVALPEEQGMLSEETAERCQSVLRTELASALAERMVGVQNPLVVSLYVQELRNGAFLLSVQIRTRKGDVVGEWSGDYSGEAGFMKQLEASVSQIAEELESSPYVMKEDRP